MKKIIIVLIAFICFGSALLSQSKYPFDVESVQKAFSLYKDADQLSSEGKSVKSERARKEAKTILDKIFAKGKIISSNDACFFKKNPNPGNTIDGDFSLICKDIELKDAIIFQFRGLESEPSDEILEKFEDINKGDFFNGRIEISENNNRNTYEYGWYFMRITVYCKIISLTPMSK